MVGIFTLSNQNTLSLVQSSLPPTSHCAHGQDHFFQGQFPKQHRVLSLDSMEVVSGTFSITVQSGKERQRDAVDCQDGIGLVLQESHVLAVLLGVCVKQLVCTQQRINSDWTGETSPHDLCSLRPLVVFLCLSQKDHVKRCSQGSRVCRVFPYLKGMCNSLEQCIFSSALSQWQGRRGCYCMIRKFLNDNLEIIF